MQRNKKIEIFASSDTEIVEMAALFFALDKYYAHVQLSFLVSDINTFGDSRLWQRIEEYKSKDNLNIVVYDMVNFVEFEPIPFESESRMMGLIAKFYYLYLQKWWLKTRSFRVRFFSIIRFFKNIIKVCGLYKSTYEFHLARFKLEPCSIALLPDNVVGPIWPPLTKACKKLNIPVMVFPFTICNQEEAVQTLRNNETVWFKNNPAISRYFPKWRYQHGDIDILRVPFPHIVAHSLLNVVPSDPWHYLSGESDVIAVDSPATYQYFLRSGIAESEMQVTGSLLQDQMAQIKKNKSAKSAEILSQLNLDPEKPIFLIGGCPNQFGSSTVYCEFDEMIEVSNALREALHPLVTNFNILVRPHPNFFEFGELLACDFIRVTDKPTYELIPLSACYLAFASATIRWALFSSVPVINYDIFNYNISEYKNRSGIAEVNTLDGITAQIRQIITDEHHLKKMSEDMADLANHWGVVGGKNIEKITSTIDRLSSQ